MKEDRYDRITKEKAVKYPELVFDFLRRVYETVYADVAAARNEIPAEMWNMYAALQITDQDEQKALRKKQFLLRTIWQRSDADKQKLYTIGPNNPVPFEVLFKKMKDEYKLGKEVAKGKSSIRSEETGTDAGDCPNT